MKSGCFAEEKAPAMANRYLLRKSPSSQRGSQADIQPTGSLQASELVPAKLIHAAPSSHLLRNTRPQVAFFCLLRFGQRARSALQVGTD